MEAVPFVGLGRQNAAIADDLRDAFDRVVGASSFVLGGEVERFEEAFAEYCGVRFCVGVASGTAALTLLLEAADIGRGDEVVVPAHTFIATALAVVHAGATPVLCDVEPGTGLMDPESAATMVGPRTAAILPVHLYGQMCEMDALSALARDKGLVLIEDAAQAHGSTYRGIRAGAAGAGAGYSFYPSKNLGGLGDGGAICTNVSEIAERARRLRNLGQLRKGEHVETGYNERLDGLQAALLSTKLVHLDGWNEQRRAHAESYRSSLAGRARLLEERPESRCMYHIFPLRTHARETFARELDAHGIQYGVHYHPAVHEHPAWDGAPLRRSDVPEAENWAREEISLPMFPELDAGEIRRVVDACDRALTEINNRGRN